MANINVSYADMEAAASTVASGRDEIYSQLDSMKAKIESLVTTGFVADKSSPAFQNAYVEFTEGAKASVRGLDGVINFLRVSENVLREADEQLAAQISR